MKRNQKGFTSVEALLILIIVGLVGFIGWYVWHSNQDTDKTLKSGSSTTVPTNKKESSPTKTNQLSLGNGAAKMTLPTSWTYTTSASDCTNTVTSKNVVCKESATITPGVKLPTIYGSGTEFFHINASLYTNSLHHSAKDFVQSDLDAGYPDPGAGASSDKSINGYDTYYWNPMNNDYHELWYAFSTQNNIVVIQARTYEPGTSNGKPAGDFRQFEPDIAKMANSISIAN